MYASTFCQHLSILLFDGQHFIIKEALVLTLTLQIHIYIIIALQKASRNGLHIFVP